MESIIFGIISNFLTDFIKKIVRIPITESTTNQLRTLNRPDTQSQTSERIDRRKRNRENAVNMTAIFFIISMPFMLLFGIAFLSIALPDLFTSSIELSTTKLNFLSGKINIFHLSIFCASVFYFPVFLIAQILTEYISIYLHREWIDITQSRLLRLFTLSIFILSVPYSGVIIFFLHPNLTFWEALKIPAISLLLLFGWAFAEKNKP